MKRLIPVILMLAAGCGALQDEAEANSAALSHACPPAAPDPSLAVPTGNRLAFTASATGVQVYACQTTAAGPAWVFVFPEATLTSKGRVVGLHFAGPTWEALDTSTVVGKREAGFAPDATAIPWLLLSASSHAGTGAMSDVTFIQRFDTVGGLAPADPCDAGHLGAVTRVSYSATYLFYRTGNAPRCDR